MTLRTHQKLSGSSRRQGWVDRGTRDGDRFRRPTPDRKLRSGAGSKGLRMLTRQKAEPLFGMKLTLLRSGHRKGGTSCRGLGLVPHKVKRRHTTLYIEPHSMPVLRMSRPTHMDSSLTLTFSQPSGGSLLNM